jgi:ABC-type polysaccharide/polyol phosphate export permease
MSVTVREQAGLWDYRALIWNFAQRDLKARFKGTALGWAWSLVVPLASLVIYTAVFSTILRMEPPPFGNGRTGNFTVWLLAGLVPWTVFANSVNTAIGALLGTGPLLKKIYFPAYAPVFGAVIAVMIQSVIELGILLVVLLAFGNVSWTWLLAVPWAVFFAVFVGALSLTLSVVNVYFRDLSHIISVAIQLLFYLCPIIYPVTFVPEDWHGLNMRAVIQANPMTQFIELFRDLVYGLTPGTWVGWVYIVGSTVVMCVIAVAVFRAKGRDLSEEL